MYKEYFGFKETPFSIAPDPRYLFMSEQHREALAHLMFGIHGDGGFVLLTGEVGTGKTTICRCLLEQLPDNCVIAFILNPKLTVLELLSTICDEFRISYTEGTTSVKVFVDHINTYLLEANARGLKTVLLIDEAQNLSSEVLEQMRLLTNLETNQRKLLQIILIGQPELRSALLRPELRQLAQRIIARFHLTPLTKQDMSAYVNHRLAVAGTRRDLFPDSVLNRLYDLSRGIPRLINLLCDRSLLGAYAQNKQIVDKKILKRAAREVLGEVNSEGKSHPGKRWAISMGLGSLVAALILTVSYSYYQSHYLNASVPDTAREAPSKESAGEYEKAVENAKPTAEPTLPEEKANLSKSQYKEPIPLPEPGEMLPDRVAAISPIPLVSPEQETAVEKSLRVWGENPDLYDLERANEALFRLWNLEYQADSSADACRQAQSQQMQCLSAVGGLKDLSTLNSPALLKFFNTKGQQFYAVMRALNGDKATFISGSDTTMTIGVDEIALWWKGDYTLLWKPPPGYRRPLEVGDQSIAVKWLRSHLSSLMGGPSLQQENNLLDNELAEQVKKFQVTHGLTPDGVAGPQTLIRLCAETEEGVPLLMDGKKDMQ